MSYDSDVCIIMKKVDYDEMRTRIYEEDSAAKSLIEGVDELIETQGEEEKIVILKWECVKWYSNFLDVQFIEGYLEELEEKDKPYTFLRIGENWDDVEHSCFCGSDGKDLSCAGIAGIQRNIIIY